MRKWVFQDRGIYLRIYNLRYTAYNVIPAKAGIQNSMPKPPVVYILASKRNGTLYIGVTNDLQRRAWDHKNDLLEGFTKRYGVHRLVY